MLRVSRTNSNSSYLPYRLFRLADGWVGVRLAQKCKSTNWASLGMATRTSWMVSLTQYLYLSNLFVCAEADVMHRWHIFTAIGAYTFIAVIDQLVSGGNHQDIEKPFAWPLSWASESIFADISSTVFEAGGKIP